MGAEPPPVKASAPRVRLRDHFRVAGLLGVTILGLIPWILYAPFAPIASPWLRRRLRRRLAASEPAVAADPDVLRKALRAATQDRARVFLIVGEASGDRMAAPVIRALRAERPGIEIIGYGGPACAEAGMRVERDFTAYAVMGVWAVIGTLGFWWRICAETLARFRESQPDLVLTVDFPGLNLRLARFARTAGIRTMHLVAPQVWAHAPWRIGRVRRAVDHVLSIMPFEPPLFEVSRVRTTFVGHPLFEAPLPPPRSTEGDTDDRYEIELWPGSRRREIRNHIAVLAASAARIARAHDDVTFTMQLASAAHEADARARWEAAASGLAFPRVRSPGDLPPGDARRIAALVTSGTATAQVAVDLVPQVVFYRLAWLTRFFSGCVLVTPWFCLANLVAGKTVAPEHLVTGPAGSEQLATALLTQIQSTEAYAARRAQLAVVRDRLAFPAVAERVALTVLSELAGSDAGAPAAAQPTQTIS